MKTVCLITKVAISSCTGIFPVFGPRNPKIFLHGNIFGGNEMTIEIVSFVLDLPLTLVVIGVLLVVVVARILDKATNWR